MEMAPNGQVRDHRQPHAPGNGQCLVTGESDRTRGKVILHLDLDAFFAQAETLAEPRLRGRPLVIGGIPGGRAAVACASYEARARGIHAGMSISGAELLCPEAVFMPCHPRLYFELSTAFMAILLRHTPWVEQASIDEAFVDARDLASSLREGDAFAAILQEEIASRLRLSVSAGIGPNKQVAKMAARLHKPGGRLTMDIDHYRARFGGEPVIALSGIGKATAGRLARAGVRTVADLANAPDPLLRGMLGISGPRLKRAARGEDDTPVVPYGAGPEPKSLGHEYTLPRDESDRGAIERILLSLCDEVGTDLQREGWVADTVHLRIRWWDFSVTTRQIWVGTPVSSTTTVSRSAAELFRRADRGGPIRSIGVSVSGLVRKDALESRGGDDPVGVNAVQIQMEFGAGGSGRT